MDQCLRRIEVVAESDVEQFAEMRHCLWVILEIIRIQCPQGGDKMHHPLEASERRVEILLAEFEFRAVMRLKAHQAIGERVDAGVHPLAYRLMCLQAHYRSELEFSEENLDAALTRLKRMVHLVTALRTLDPDDFQDDPQTVAHFRKLLDVALSDDLNTPKALVHLSSMLAHAPTSPTDKLRLLEDYDAVLGLNLLGLTREDLRVRPAATTLTAEEVEARLVERREARLARDFARSDAIRDELAAQGVEVMDGDPLGWDWRPTLA